MALLPRSSVVSFYCFYGSIKGSEPHSQAFPVGVEYLRHELPLGPASDAQISLEKEKLARFRRIPARFCRNPTGYRRNHY
jgi:hypothetical protein